MSSSFRLFKLELIHNEIESYLLLFIDGMILFFYNISNQIMKLVSLYFAIKIMKPLYAAAPGLIMFTERRRR